MGNSENFDILTRQRQEASQKRMLHNQYVEHNKMKSANLKADIDAYKENGMNVGLIYGGSGAGGTTTTSSGTSGGSAPTSNGMGMIQGGQMGMQMAQLQADLDLKEAQADNLRADAENKRGIEREEAGARIDSLTQGVSNMQTEQALTEIKTLMEGLNYQKESEVYDDRIKQIKNAAKMSNYELNIAKNDSSLSDETYNEKVKLVEQELINKVLESKQIIANTNLTNEQNRRISQELAQGWESLTLEDERNKIEKFKVKTNAILGRENLKLREREMIINGVSQTLGTLNAGRRKTTTRTTDKYDGDGNHQGGTITTETR